MCTNISKFLKSYLVTAFIDSAIVMIEKGWVRPFDNWRTVDIYLFTLRVLGVLLPCLLTVRFDGGYISQPADLRK